MSALAAAFCGRIPDTAVASGRTTTAGSGKRGIIVHPGPRVPAVGGHHETRGVKAGVLRHARRVLALACTFAVVHAAEVIPPAPTNHFNDYARIVSPATAQRLDEQLAQFERETSNQIVVAVFPRMESDSSVEDYTVRVAQRWGVGQRDRRNGAVLFVFQQSRDIRIVTGYGLEGAIPDARAKQIIENEIAPAFRAGNFDAGLTAGVNALMAAARGEYRGTGRTAAQTTSTGSARGGSSITTFVVFVIVILLLSRRSRRGGMLYGGRGRTMWGGTPWIGGGRHGGWGGGGGWSGGRSGGGGSFSGGGGSFGGGGAGGKW